ncbi:MAG: hypothetical protein ABI779_18900 [Acidobacteriota bacterium]
MRRFLLLCALAFPLSANPIRLTLAVEPMESLPGVPVTFRVTAINTSSAPARLAPFVALEVTVEGVAFDAYAGFRGDADVALLPVANLTSSWIDFAPGEERRFDYVASPDSPPWFCDERLQHPGTYRLRLRADRIRSPMSMDPVPDPAISNQAVFTVGTPSGDDALAWALIRDGNLCMGWSHQAERLWSQYPDSVYTSMCVRPYPHGDREAEMASFQAALDKGPPEGFADAFKESIAALHVMFMEKAIPGDVEGAFAHSEAARVIFEELAAKDTDFSIKMAAQKGLRVDVMTLAELQDYDRRTRAVDPPVPQCESAQVATVRAEIAAFANGTGVSRQTRSKLEMVLKNLDQYSAQLTKTPPAMSKAMQELRSAGGEIHNANGSLVPVEDGTRWLKALTVAAALSARKAVEAAASSPAVRSGPLSQAQHDLEDALGAASGGDFRKALQLFKAALDKAESASEVRGSFC